MYVTPLNFEQVLDRFYNQIKYELMLLFVSSFDGNDRSILKGIVDNAKRIDRITGDRICFFYFIKDAYDGMNESLTRWVKDISEWEPLYGEGVNVTMETADDICRHFGILRSNLPAFILVGKNKREEPQVFSIHEYNDFERFLTPLNILHAYVDDRRSIITRYESKKRRGVVTQKQVDERNEQRHSWIVALERLEKKKAKELLLGLTDKTDEREQEIQKFRKKLADNLELKQQGEDETIIFPQQELDLIRKNSIERLNISLNTSDGERMIDDMASAHGYFNTVLKIWEAVRSRSARISRIIENIRYQICEHGFDVFISCKSQDYALAHELYDYLVYNGFKPFLADTSIKEVGIDQYTALIGEVINVCQNMIVFATNPDYIETPYVAAEWHTFVNDINTGHKPNSKLVNILAPNIDVHNLPAWLRDKQCFTTENYKDGLIHFLHNRDNKIAERLLDEVNKVYSRIRDNADQLLRHYRGGEVEYMVCRFKDYVERDYRQIVSRLDRFRIYGLDSYDINMLELDELRVRAKRAYKEWEDGLRQLTQDVEQYIEKDESEWYKAMNNGSMESLKDYLEHFPNGFHYQEALERLKCFSEMIKKTNAVPISFSPSTELKSKGFQPSDDECMVNGAAVGAALPMVLGGPIGAILCGISGWFHKKTNNMEKYVEVYSSVFAPSEVKRKSHMLVQVYLHLYEETEKVKALAQESDKNAERRDYIPLQCKLKKGDKVDVLLNIYGETLLMSDKKSVIWQGSFTKCSFDYFVPKDIDVDELSCVAMLTVNGVPVGEMRFITRIVDAPRQLNPEIIAHKYNKVFISYSHQDESKVKFLHEGLELGAVPHFFDRKYLKAGDVFPQVIQDYINSADLFILCWSENASKSEYVQKERLQALERAFPQVKPEQEAKLRIYPMSIEPRAELPTDMKENYHFGEM